MKYFGTDGIRGRFGSPLMNPEFCRRIGYALGRFLARHNSAKPVTVCIGRDTRASGPVIEDCLVEGLCFHGAHVYRLGVVPTPGVSQMVQQLRCDLGIAITASHNPAEDNGIKLFDNVGLKFAADAETEIERFIDEEPAAPVQHACPESYEHDGAGHYANYLRSLLHQNCLRGWRIVLDTANGATVETSYAVLKHYGAELIRFGDAPNGENINRDCGSEFPKQLSRAVRESGAKLGIAHDGDGDRVLFCDETGQIVDGEQVLGIFAIDALQRKALARDTFVTTVHSNMGLDAALAKKGIKVVRVDVGDRNILLRMREKGYSIGGESSGHIIFMEHSMSGDGLLSAIRMIDTMMRTGQPLSVLRKQIELFPSISESIKVVEKKPADDCPHLVAAIEQAEANLGAAGRILVRYSGTEPKLRLLVEGPGWKENAAVMTALIDAAERDLQFI